MSDEPAEKNPLAEFTDEQLLAELERRERASERRSSG
jgi:hypothetical protein